MTTNKIMLDETENISRKTWARNIEPVNKMGYMDGAADGQAVVFQSSFDMGYKQGFGFGLELGFSNAKTRLQQQGNTSEDQDSLRDPRKINCEICTSGVPSEQNVVNLYNSQQEKNNQVLQQKQSKENDKVS